MSVSTKISLTVNPPIQKVPFDCFVSGVLTTINDQPIINKTVIINMNEFKRWYEISTNEQGVFRLPVFEIKEPMIINFQAEFLGDSVYNSCLSEVKTVTATNTTPDQPIDQPQPTPIDNILTNDTLKTALLLTGGIGILGIIIYFIKGRK